MCVRVCVYSEYVIDESDVSDIWTSDSNIWLVNAHRSERSERVQLYRYIAGTSEYIWYTTGIHSKRILYIRCDTEIRNNSNTDIEKFDGTTLLPYILGHA